MCRKMSLTMALACEAEIVASGKPRDDKGRASPLLFIMTRFQGEFRQGQIALGLARARVTSGAPKDRAAESSRGKAV